MKFLILLLILSPTFGAETKLSSKKLKKRPKYIKTASQEEYGSNSVVVAEADHPKLFEQKEEEVFTPTRKDLSLIKTHEPPSVSYEKDEYGQLPLPFQDLNIKKDEIIEDYKSKRRQLFTALAVLYKKPDDVKDSKIYKMANDFIIQQETQDESLVKSYAKSARFDYENQLVEFYQDNKNVLDKYLSTHLPDDLVAFQDGNDGHWFSIALKYFAS